MDELMLSDKRYISTRRAGKEHGYHSDYIGQLIRGGKVLGQKVGRAWYVEEESLATYLGKEVPQQAKTSGPVMAKQKVEVAPEMLPSVESAEESKPAPVVNKIVEPEKVVEVIKVEAPIEVKKEERVKIAEQPVAIRKEVAKPAREINIPPITSRMLTEEEVEGDETYSGLKYVPDDEPLLPEIAPKPIVSRQEDAPLGSAPEPVPSQQKKSRGLVGALVLGVIGIIAVTLSAAASTFVSSKISVIEGQTANVSYTVGQ